MTNAITHPSSNPYADLGHLLVIQASKHKESRAQ